MLRLSVIVLIVTSFACTSPRQGKETGLVPHAWVEDRVDRSKERLSQSDGGKLIDQAIEAHGGLGNWFSNGALSFHFDYMPTDDKTRRNTFQVINQWSVQSVHELAADRAIRFGWDGQTAWVSPDTAQVPINVRFWANTPFYFIGLPFVLADPGTIHTQLEADTLDGKPYDLVKVTYQSDTGDAPDDYYIIYLDQDTHLMVALRYIVSYPAFFPDGGHAPEKIMKLNGLVEVNGIKLATGYKTYWWKGSVGEHITNIEVDGIEFLTDITTDYFNRPADSREVTGL